MSLGLIIQHVVRTAGITGDYFYFIDGEPENGEMSLDIFFKGDYSKLPFFEAYFDRGLYIDDEYWCITDRLFSAGKNGNADFGCTFIKGISPVVNLPLSKKNKTLVY